MPSKCSKPFNLIFRTDQNRSVEEAFLEVDQIQDLAQGWWDWRTLEVQLGEGIVRRQQVVQAAEHLQEHPEDHQHREQRPARILVEVGLAARKKEVEIQ